MSLPSDGDNPEDLRDTLNQKLNQCVSLGSGRRRHVMARGEDNVPYARLLHQYSCDQQERTSTNSDFERRHRSDGGALQSPDSSCEQSSKDSYRGSVRRDRSRSARSSPLQTERDREDSTERRGMLRRGRRVQEKLAVMPTQKTHHQDLRYNGVSHESLPIRSLSEKCTAAEQHRRWVNDSPTRSTEILPEINRWINHFKAAEHNPIHLATLSPEGLDKTRWWRKFLVEVKAINVYSVWR